MMVVLPSCRGSRNPPRAGGVPTSVAGGLAARASSHWCVADRAVAAIAPDLVVSQRPRQGWPNSRRS